jgi:sugar lactone lactonase YvrE
VTGWIDAPPGRTLGAISMIDIAPDGTLWIAERCGANDCLASYEIEPILHVTADGRWLGAFGSNVFAWPHGLHIDAVGNIWVTDAREGDDRGHQVVKFAADGRELMRLGAAGRASGGPAHFDGPTDVVVAPDGSVSVSDGHEPDSNKRIVKFSADGRYVKEWGGTGSAPGRFRVPHALALDSRGRLFVADRDNNRLQIFDQEGNLIAQWTQFGRPSGMHSAPDDTLYVSDNQSNDERNPGRRRGIYVGSAKDGTVHAFIPDPEFDPKRAQETGAHGIAVDASGTIYGAEVYSQTVKKYLR